MDNLITLLKNNNTLLGIKQSFEDEGARHEDVIVARLISSRCGKLLNLKIGGCEAISDINFATYYGIDGIVAPMIESEFSLRKFIQASKNCNADKFFNIETISCVNSIDSILGCKEVKQLTGVVIGRSDLCQSMGLSKTDVDSFKISKIVQDVAYKAKSYNLQVMLGGSLSTKSISLIEELVDKKLLDRVETRNVIISVDDSKKVSNSINDALEWEMNWMKYKSKNYTNISKEYSSRLSTIAKRTVK